MYLALSEINIQDDNNIMTQVMDPLLGSANNFQSTMQNKYEESMLDMQSVSYILLFPYTNIMCGNIY